LFEIAVNLKSCKGRVVARSTRIQRYPEKSYYILEDIKPDLKENVMTYSNYTGNILENI